MKKLTFAFMLLFAMACSKNEDASKLNLTSALMGGGDTDPDSTGFTGISGCYWTLNNTLENPPSGYIPGSAETAFGTCAEPYMDLSGGGPTLKKYPPAPPVTFTKVPPEPTVSNDNRVIMGFFNLYGFDIDGNPPMDYPTAGALINTYNSLIVSALEAYPTDNNTVNKINSCVTYIFNNPPADPSFNRTQFLDYVNNVAYKYSAPLRITTAFANQLGVFNVEGIKVFNILIIIRPPFL